MAERQLDGDQGQILEELLCLHMGQSLVELRIDNTPEVALLRYARLVLAVQERDVEHLLRVVAPVLAHLLVLEVRVLNVAVLLEFLDFDLGLGHCGSPAVVSERDAVAKPFDRSLEHLEEDVLDVELLLQADDVLLLFAGIEGPVGAGPHVLARLAHVAPEANAKISSQI